MDVTLVVDQGTAKRRTWQLHHEDTVIGRRQDCHLRILSAEVSRRHCLLSIRDGFLSVEDLDSFNGTYVNGKRVVGKQILRPGDHLEIGPLDFLVEYALPQAALNRLEQESNGVAPDEEELEVLPVSLEDPNAQAAAVADEDEPLDVLPLADKDTELAPEKGKQGDSRSTPSPAEEAEPLAVDEEEAANWHLPQTNQLRDLLSQLDEPESPRRGG